MLTLRRPAATAGGYGFRHSSASDPVTARLTARWVVSWHGSGAAAASMPVITIQAADSFRVQQSQVINR